MREHGSVTAERTPPHPVPRPGRRRGEDPGAAGPGPVATTLLGLQRTAGNAAVTAFVQRCGPTPCDCSTQERAAYAEEHPDEPATPAPDAAAGGHAPG